MASELRVDTLKDSSGNNSVGMAYVAEGSAKAWVNFNGTGTIATRNSLNISSLSDAGTGDYDINISSSFTAADYSINASAYPSASWNQMLQLQNPSNNTGSIFSVMCASTSGTLNDTQLVCADAHGDLA